MSKVLIVGSGGREHALGWKIAQDEEVSEVLYAPGNAGTYNELKGRNVKIDGTKKEGFKSLLYLIESEKVDLTIVGPEQPLADGLVDFLNSRGYHRVFGPTRAAARLESDKFYSYDLMNSLGIPKAKSFKCYTEEEAMDLILEDSVYERIGISDRGVVVKARGLTGGKGVSIFEPEEDTDNLYFASLELQEHIEKYGQEVLIAERLFGEEFSVFGISDGERVSPLEISLQDHKRLMDNDEGPNTGGMGAYGPAPMAPLNVVRNIIDNIMNPVVRRMKADGVEYKGFIYAGMIMTEEGPKVLEFNSRLGDPECQPAMMMISSGLYKSLSLALDGKLEKNIIKFRPGAACCVVLASQGYPLEYKEGLSISGLENIGSIKGIKVFHSGTKLVNGKIVTSGGRVLGVTAYSPSGIGKAREKAYELAERITIPGGFHYRRDIANKALS